MKVIDVIPKRALAKLEYWAAKRLDKSGVNFRFLNEEGKDYYFQQARKSIFECVQDLVIDNKATKLAYWKQILSNREQTVLRDFINPELFKVGKTELGSPVLDTWYSLGFDEIGSYNTFKEPEIDGITFEGKTVGIITRNQYDCDVLNAENMMIVDVDLEGDSTRDYDPVIAINQTQALAALESFVASKPEFGFRVYKTAAGLRYICTTTEVDPSSFGVSRILRSLYCDPRYRNLCQTQETFRARLTPKPWRYSEMYYRQSMIGWHQIASERDHYLTSSEVGVCELIKVVGNDKILPQFSGLVYLHDQYTHALAEDLEYGLA